MSDSKETNKITGISFAPWPFKSCFPMGLILATHGALEVMQQAGIEPLALLKRHSNQDWGELGAEDKMANDEALINGDRLLSSYRINQTEKIWIITECDRSCTTLLRPEEY